MSDTTKAQIGRIAFRVEGDLWNAYYAQHDTMEGAIFLGSLRMLFARQRKHKDAFRELIRACAYELIRDAVGAAPVWDKPKSAPEHERGGSA